MKNLPRPARIYVSVVIALGVCLLLLYAPYRGIPKPHLFIGLLLLSSVCAAFKVNLPLSRSASTMSVSYAVHFLALMVLGPNPTMLICIVAVVSQTTVKPKARNPLYRILFSMAALVITVHGAGNVMLLLTHLLGGAWPNVLGTIAGGVTVYFLLNSLLVATAVALSSQQSVWTVWQENFLWSAPGYFLGSGFAALAARFIESSSYYLAFFAIVPLYLTYRAYRVYMGRVRDEQQHVEDISNLHLATVEALALAIDAKDQRSHTHIRRMQVFAATVGKALGMNGEEIDGLRTAALLHDIGKLAVPEHILSKPGPLTPDEVKKVRIHPVVGAEIIAQVPFPYPVAPLILCHHERWDGRGYPSGLKGDEIPLGARIIAVIDFYDALISDRPYHPAMSAEAAARLVQQEAGRAFDPKVVNNFMEMLPELPRLVESSSPSLLKPRVIHGLSPQAAAAVGDQSQVLQNIALAHREIYALYEIAQAMGTSLGVTDTMKLISSKLTSLVPFSCCALYLYNDTNDALRCRFATGTDADIVRRVMVKSGHGMTGWVARNRRPLLNARPTADLEASDIGVVPTKLQAALVCPLVFNEEVIGTLGVYHTEPNFYNEDHTRLLDRVCEQAAAVIANSIVFEKTQQDSLTDALTTLPNTRFLFMHLTRELARAERLKSEVSLLIMDLDDFKDINDKYGHHVGDRALQEVASALRSAIRPYDICVRYAGDEFIVVLPGCGGDEAENKRQELQLAVDAIRLEARPGKLIPIGVSAGVAVFPVDGDGYESLLAIADARMYRDKTRRKKARTRRPLPPDDASPPGLTDIDLHRSALGIL